MGVTRREESSVLHLSIIKGTLMQKSTEDNPDAVRRDWEDSDGNKGTKWEIPYSSVEGLIVGVDFKDGDYGEQVIVSMTDVDEKIKIYMPTDSRYFTDFAKKLPNINLWEDVTLSPYDFDGDNGKQNKGVSIKQGGEKLHSFYYDFEDKKTINNLPQPDKNASTKDHEDKYDKDDWKIFFMKQKKFLKKAVMDMSFPKVPKKNIKDIDVSAETVTAPTDEHDDLPF